MNCLSSGNYRVNHALEHGRVYTYHLEVRIDLLIFKQIMIIN